MEVLRHVVERIARITEAASTLRARGLQATSARVGPVDSVFQGQYALQYAWEGTLRWQVQVRSLLPERYFVDAVEFQPEPGWWCTVGEPCPAAIYERFEGTWRPLVERRPPWRVLGVGDDPPVISAPHPDSQVLCMQVGQFALAYREAEHGLRLARLGMRPGCAKPLVPAMPEAADFDLDMARTDGRAAYLEAARRWSERYVAACEAWADSLADVPALLPREGDAYVSGALRIPAALFDFDGLMTRLLARLDALAVHIPPTEAGEAVTG